MLIIKLNVKHLSKSSKWSTIFQTKQYISTSLCCSVLTPVTIQQGGQTQTLTLQPAQPPQGQSDGQNQTTVVAQSGQQGQQQQQQFLQVSLEGSKYHVFK